MEEKNKKDELLSKAQRICSEREYCESDIRSKLESWGEADDTIVNAIISSLKKDKFIDEERYAGAFARDRFKYQQWGKVKIAAQMKQKHIPSAVITAGLSTIDDKEYLDMLREILLRHHKNIKAKNRYDLKGKLLRHALAKGFESRLVYEMVNQITGANESE